jgi:hypothetical protein
MTKINLVIGDRPRFESIDVDLIDVDGNYQRELDGKKVERMLAEFHWDHFGSVIVAAQPDGRYTVTDGQHRVKTAKLHPRITHVPAMIISRSGVEAEAENFLVINRDRKTVSSVERYWAGLAAGDEMSKRVRDVLHSVGCDIAPDQGTCKPHLTNSVTAVTRSLERYGDKATRLAIDAIRKAWPKEDKALRGSLITSMARIVEANDDIDFERLRKTLAPKSFKEMAAAAESLRRIAGGDASTALARTITELYNRGLSVKTIHFGAQ